MAGSKIDKDVNLGLTPSQAKLILLGALFMEEGGKVRSPDTVPRYVYSALH
jgi:hypothetical protein